MTGYIIFYGKKDLADEIKLRILTQKFILDYPGRLNAMRTICIRKKEEEE
jgi:hypothetical protein